MPVFPPCTAGYTNFAEFHPALNSAKLFGDLGFVSDLDHEVVVRRRRSTVLEQLGTKPNSATSPLTRTTHRLFGRPHDDPTSHSEGFP